MTTSTTTSSAPNAALRKRRPWWVWLLYALVFTILVAAMALYWAWSNRAGLLEQLAIDTLAEDGVTAELQIDEIDKTHIILSRVALSFEDDVFFAAKRIRADYVWREALQGRFNKLEFTNPEAKITLDAQGKIIDGWVPPGLLDSNDDQDVRLPPQGVTITDGRFTVGTPYGTTDIDADAHIADLDNFNATLSMDQADLTFKDGTVTAAAALVVQRKDGRILIDGDLRFPRLDHPVMDGTDITTRFDGTVELKENSRRFAGNIAARFDNLNTAQAEFSDGQIDWQGDINHSGGLPDLDGTWRANFQSVRLPDPVRTRDLARTLSLTPALSATPIAQNFVGELEANLVTLMTDSALSAAGSLTRNDTGAAITLSQPMQAKTSSTMLTLSPTASSAPTYQFDRAANIIEANFDVETTTPVGLSARGARLKARSLNGWQIDGVEQFSAQIATTSTWRNSRVPARLSPFTASVDYDGRNSDNRQIKLNGKINYDGPVPGAIVQQLRTGGLMGVALRGNTLSLNYAPSGNRRVTIDKLRTQTDWLASDVALTLSPSTPLYTRTGNTAKVEANVSDVSLNADRLTDPAQLRMIAQSADITGVLKTQRASLQQNWRGEFVDALITSEDLPGPNTRIALGDGTFTSQLMSGDTPQFTLLAPQADVQSELIQAKAIQIDVAGTPNDFILSHAGGQVKLSGNDLPPLPIEGRVNFINGQYEGQAVAFLPQANDTPINIDYIIRDSAGTAIVDIDALTFKPGSLQPQALIPALRGKIARVEGQVSAKINLIFGANQPLQSSGTAKLLNMNFGTAPGPLTGVSTELDLASVLPLQTAGRQTMTVDSFDPGLPLENGVIEYELVEEGVKVYSARWPLGDGFFSLDPFTWQYNAPENRVVLRLEKVGLGEFLNNLGDGAIEATGDLEGTFPIVISGIDVTVDGGRLYVKDGGVIRYQAKEAAAAGQANEYAGKALEALKDFRYRELSAEINGPLDGDIEVGLIFDGKNPEVLNGQPFAFDVTVTGELFNIMRSFNTSAQIKAQLADKGIKAAIE